MFLCRHARIGNRAASQLRGTAAEAKSTLDNRNGQAQAVAVNSDKKRFG